MRSEVTTSRRLFLRTAAATAGGAATALAAGQAHAFRLLPQDDYASQLENSCVVDTAASHRQLLAEVQKELGIELDEREAQEILKQMACPLCGCNLQQAYLDTSSGF